MFHSDSFFHLDKEKIGDLEVEQVFSFACKQLDRLSELLSEKNKGVVVGNHCGCMQIAENNLGSFDP